MSQNSTVTTLRAQALGLIRIAASLDAAGMHAQADVVLGIAERYAQSPDRDVLQNIPGYNLYGKAEQSGLAQGLGVAPLAEVGTYQSNDPSMPNAPMQFYIPPGMDAQTANHLRQMYYWQQLNALTNQRMQMDWQNAARWHGPQSWQAMNTYPYAYQGGVPAPAPVLPTIPGQNGTRPNASPPPV